MNAKRLIVTLVFVVILMGFILWMTDVFIQDAGRKNKIWREQSQKVTDAIDYIKGKQYDVMFYGEDLNGPKAFTPRHIYNFEYESINGEGDLPEHFGHVIIINDLSGKAPIDKEIWDKLHDLLIRENYVIIYLGSTQLPKMQKSGFFFDVYPEGTKSVAFWNFGRDMEIGFADDPSIVPEVVREPLTPEQCSVYAMIMKIYQKHYI